VDKNGIHSSFHASCFLVREVFIVFVRVRVCMLFEDLLSPGKKRTWIPFFFCFSLQCCHLFTHDVIRPQSIFLVCTVYEGIKAVFVGGAGILIGGGKGDFDD